MKKILYFMMLSFVCGGANAGFDGATLIKEVSRGVDIIAAPSVVQIVPQEAPGALGAEVYEYVDTVEDDFVRVFVPTDMYVRMGGGLNMGFASSYADFNGSRHESSGSYTSLIGLGWNLSSYVRTEIDFQSSTFKFSDIDDMSASYQTLGGMVYFDLAHRYIQSGDVTRRRVFVPFIGAGAAFGAYEFNGADGANGFVVAAPRASVGFNLKLNDLIGVDVFYQYQMMIGNGFGWNSRHGGTNDVSNIMATFRFEF